MNSRLHKHKQILIQALNILNRYEACEIIMGEETDAYLMSKMDNIAAEYADCLEALIKTAIADSRIKEARPLADIFVNDQHKATITPVSNEAY